MPHDVPAVVDMAADKDIEALLEKQVGELGMLMPALGQTETHVAGILGPGRFTVRARRFDLRHCHGSPYHAGKNDYLPFFFLRA